MPAANSAASVAVFGRGRGVDERLVFAVEIYERGHRSELQWLAATGSDVVAVFDDVGSVAVDEVMVGDRCIEEFAHVVEADIEADEELVPPMFVAVEDALPVKIKHLTGMAVEPREREVGKDAGRDARDDVFVVDETEEEVAEVAVALRGKVRSPTRGWP